MASRFPTAETWRPCPTVVIAGHMLPVGAFYAISSHGRVKRTAPGPGTWPGRICRLTEVEDGRRKVTINLRGQKRKLWVGQMAAVVWVGPAPSNHHEVVHLDGNKANDAAHNLAWMTSREKRLHTSRLKQQGTLAARSDSPS